MGAVIVGNALVIFCMIAMAKRHDLDQDGCRGDRPMLVSAEPNLHSLLSGCYKIALHFGSAETQYLMRCNDRSRGGIDLLRSDEEVCLASKHNPFDAENGGGR
jgi:hypothetical protein